MVIIRVGIATRNSEMRRCLIVSGGYEPHCGEVMARHVGALLTPEGFEVSCRDSLSAYEEEDLCSYDLIVPNWTVGILSPEATQRLDVAIKSGVGLGGFHGGMLDGFPSNERFRYMVGGSYVAEPGKLCNYTVEVTRPDDGVMQGITNFIYFSEQYYMHVDPAVEVLAVTQFTASPDPWIDGVVMPTVWKKMYGKGRVFVSALGHAPTEFQNQSMCTILKRGLLWAAR